MDVKMGLSLFLGVFSAIIVFVICLFLLPEIALLMAVFSAAFVMLLMHIVLTVSEEHANKKYAAAEKQIKSPILYKVNGNFNLGYKIKNGNIYFCEAGIVFISLDEKPYAYDEVLKTDIDGFEFDNIHLNIYTKDGRVYSLTIPNVDGILRELRNGSWLE